MINNKVTRKTHILTFQFFISRLNQYISSQKNKMSSAKNIRRVEGAGTRFIRRGPNVLTPIYTLR